jgi:putative ABC transport system substrate-binding protein
LVGPRVARSQASRKVYRIGFLANHVPLSELQAGSGPSYTSHGAFVEGMRKLGWEEGRNIEIHWRSAESEYERHRDLAQALVRMRMDVIVSFSEGAEAAAKATRSIPIVMGGHVNPVRAGLADSLARPGRNVTGLASSSGSELGKSFSLMKETVPRLSRIAMLIHSAPPDWVDRAPTPSPDGPVGKLARELALDLFYQVCRDGAAIDAAIRGAVRQGAQALWIEPNFGIYKHARAARIIAGAAIAHRVPIMQGELRAAEEGGLMAHGVDNSVAFRRVPYYVDRILRGGNPGEMPIEQPTRVEFHVNLSAARAIGLQFPASVLLQADRVIEEKRDAGAA